MPLPARPLAQHLVRTFEDYFTTEKEDPNPSSYYTSEMVLLRDEETLPLDLRLYVDWNPLCDRSHAHWHWFAPERVFRLPDEDWYLVAQCMQTKRWLTWNVRTGHWTLPHATFENIAAVLSSGI
jgi:hypothetical protein|tara:strand:+ start:508 stop:879 length:372 start_codon:yes stop_codon:yes gene_type:complete